MIARTFLEFAIDYQPIFRERMQKMWPALKDILDKDKKKPARRKKKKARKKSA